MLNTALMVTRAARPRAGGGGQVGCREGPPEMVASRKGKSMDRAVGVAVTEPVPSVTRGPDAGGIWAPSSREEAVQ